MTPSCTSCTYSKWDRSTGHLRCHSPQLQAFLGKTGIITNFERGEIEPGRDNLDTRQCGPDGHNFVKRETAV
jgi:hypothetical protein